MKTSLTKISKPSTQLAKINFGLTEGEFKVMANELSSGNEDLFERIFLSHFSDCLTYLKSNFNTPHNEAYDITMETLIDFRHGLLNEKFKYGNLRYLFTKMASQKLFKIRKKEAKITIIDECPEIEDVIQNSNEEDLNILQKAWSSLDLKSQLILKKFYFNKMKLKDISESENIGYSAIRKQKERSIIALKTKFIQLKKASI